MVTPRLPRALALSTVTMLVFLACSSSPDAGPTAADAGTSEAGDDGPAAPIDAGADVTADADASLPPLGITVTPAPATAIVRGTVRDAMTKAAVAATVSVGAASSTADASGDFAFDAPSGHQVLTVAAPGYVPFVIPIGVARHVEPWQVSLAPANATVSVGAAATNVTSNGATLAFPAGAYAQATNISATYVTNLASTPGPTSFEDATGAAFAVRGVFHVEAGAQPAQPVVVEVPVSPGVTAANVRLSELGTNGVWGPPIAPIEVNGGFARYTVTHFSDYGEGERTTQPRLVLRSVTGNVTATVPNGSSAAAVPGTTYPIGTRFGASPGAQAAWSLALEPVPSSDTIGVSGRGTVDDAAATVKTEGSGLVADLTCPKDVCAVRAYANRRPAPGKPRPPLTIRSRSVASGVRGTTVAMDIEPCKDTKRGHVRVEVSAGEVDLAIDGRAGPVAGVAEACTGCAQPKDTACCWKMRSSGEVGCSGDSPPTCATAASLAICPDGKTYEATCGAGAGGCACTCREGGKDGATCSYATSCPAYAPPCADDVTSPVCAFPDPVKNAVDPPRCRAKEDCPAVFTGCSAGYCAWN